MGHYFHTLTIVAVVWITLAAMSGDFIRPVESVPVRDKEVVTGKTPVADTKDIKIPAKADTKDITIPAKAPKPGNAPAIFSFGPGPCSDPCYKRDLLDRCQKIFNCKTKSSG